MAVSGKRSSALRVAVLEPQQHAAQTILKRRLGDGSTIRFAESNDTEARLAVAADADVWLAGGLPLDGPFFELKPPAVIHVLGTGSDQIEVGRAREGGCSVLVASGSNAVAVAEMAILLILAVLRNLRWADAELRAGRFRKSDLRNMNSMLFRKRLGIVGMGHVGHALVERALPFGCEIAYFDERRDLELESTGVAYASLDELLGQSDILSLHVPLNTGTRDLLDRRRLALLPRGAIIVNTSRGGLIDEEALVEALQSGHIAGAGLDVMRDEPALSGNPLLQFDQVTVTPHVAGAALDNLDRVAERVAQNLDDFFGGRPIRRRDDIVYDARQGVSPTT